jgi:hypothetical protein
MTDQIPEAAENVSAFTFRLPAGERTFTLIAEPTAAMYDFVTLNRSALLQGDDESNEAYSRRIYAWIFSDPARLQSVMRMALYGDHSGIEWYYHGDPVLMATVFVEFFLQVLPKVRAAAANTAALDALSARTRNLVAADAQIG